MILGIIQARMGSSRLPNKVLLDIAGKPSILWIYERLSQSKFIDKVVVSTSISEKDDLIETFCNEHNLPYYRGEEEDLLDRLYKTCVQFNADHFVRITGDCPLVDPRIVDLLISFYLNQKDLDYASNNLMFPYPHGIDAEIFRVLTFKKVWEEVTDPKMRALAGAYIYLNQDQFKVASIKYSKDLPMRVTLDYYEDLQLIREIFKYFGKKMFYLEDLEKLYEDKPDLFDINNCRKSHTRKWDCEKYFLSQDKN